MKKSIVCSIILAALIMSASAAFAGGSTVNPCKGSRMVS